MNKKELWLNIASYHFDHLVSTNLLDVIISKFGGQNPFTKAFADKLSRKLNWNKDFAMRSIWEYKKFVFLGVISDFSVTPSKVIDQVWHEHLLFTNGYRKFCEEVIQYDFTHHPELIPVTTQTEVFKAQYFQTLEMYEREFGAAPPFDIWDTTKFSEKKKLEETYFIDSSIIVSSTSYESDSTLVSMFSGDDNHSFSFDGGDFGGGGSSGSWGDSFSDSSDSGSDSGSSCSSSCGSGCGGGD